MQFNNDKKNISKENLKSQIFDLLGQNGALENFNHNNLRENKHQLTSLAHTALNNWEPLSKSHLPTETPFQIIDFFCGAGGMSLGFAALSRILPFFQVVGGCDIDEDALNTFESNFDAPGIQQDIQDMVDDEQVIQTFLDKLRNYSSQKPLIVIGCAPCQGFTSHRKKNWAEEDERNTLVGAFASLAVKLNPVCIIMENVPEILSKKYWQHYKEARDEFEKSGYIVKQSIYNAASFGVPQERFRAVIIAMKEDFLLPEPLFDPEEYITVRQAIGHLPNVEPGEFTPNDKFHRSARHKHSTIQTIQAVPQNGGSRPKGVGPECLDRINGFSDVYGRLYWDKPAITITRYARNPASGRFVHPEQHRGLTMREAAILQSFPQNFEFSGSFDSVFKQIGEAVPPKLSCGIAASLLVELLCRSPLEHHNKTAIPSITKPVSNSFSSVIAGIKSKRR